MLGFPMQLLDRQTDTHTKKHRLQFGVKMALKRRRKNYGLTFFTTKQSQIFLEYKNVARNLSHTYNTILYCIVQLN